MARKFLYLIAALIGVALVFSLVYRLFGDQMLRVAMVPGRSFAQPAVEPANAYASADMWIARPDEPQNPALWLPPGVTAGPRGPAAVFFVHPTSYLSRSAWNAPLDDRDANDRAALLVRGQASAFAAAGEVWAPRYRQATFGAFLTQEADAKRAIDAAYTDVLAAFDSFVGTIPKGQPIILAGHSQGSLHILRLLKDRVAGKPVAKRVVAAYIIGWPVAVLADLHATGLSECSGPDATGCILSWQSFAEPAEPGSVLDTFDASTGLTGTSRKGQRMICTNPLTGTPDSAAPASANLGTVVPSADLKTATFIRSAVPARCDGGRGLLLIGEPPKMGPYVLPGNNYHVYDYSLFWANIRADAARRVAAFTRK
jgi:hypothetical protein